MAKKNREKATAPDIKTGEKEKLIFLVIAGCIVIGTLIYYIAGRETSSVQEIHDFGMVTEDPAVGSMLERFKNDPEDLETLVNLGNYYYDNTNFAMAEMFYRKALEVEPHDTNVMVDLATALFYMDRGNEAIEIYKSALELNPEHKNAMFNLGVVLDSMGNREEAISWWRRFLEVAGDDPHVEPIRKMIAEMEMEMKEGGSEE